MSTHIDLSLIGIMKLCLWNGGKCHHLSATVPGAHLPLTIFALNLNHHVVVVMLMIMKSVVKLVEVNTVMSLLEQIFEIVKNVS